MTRIYLAFLCFFAVLFRGRLPDKAVALLSPVPSAGPGTPEGEPAAGKPGVVLPTVVQAPTPAAPVADVRRNGDLRTEGALALLGLLQREGRLVDFLRESVDNYQDAEIGAAVRDVHRGCRKVLEEHLQIEPVLPGQEEAPVIVPAGFDPTEVRLIGETQGVPPWKGILLHHGWRARNARFPILTEGVDRRVLAPAEVRIS